jgi:hypothetical protein
VNDALLAPAAIATCPGTVTPGLSLETVALPAAVAPPERVMVQVAVLPAGTNAGAQFRLLMVTVPLPGGGVEPPPPPPGGGVDVEPVKEIDADCEDPLYAAVTTAD